MSATAVEQVWRDEWGRVLALLVAQYRRLDLAEDALADAFEAAARTWPARRRPGQPAGVAADRRPPPGRRPAAGRGGGRAQAAGCWSWTPTVQQRAHAVARRPRRAGARRAAAAAAAVRPPVAGARGGLRAEPAAGARRAAPTDVARLFLTSTPTMAARLTRAKRKLVVAGRAAGRPRRGARWPQRVGVVAAVAYLAFTAGYAPGSGPDPVRADLASEGDPARPGGAATCCRPRPMLRGAARADAAAALAPRRARAATAGRCLVLLPDQDRARWHHDEIAEALRAARLRRWPRPPRRRHP